MAATLPHTSSRMVADQLAPMPAPSPLNKVPTALLWLRRDLRVADNPALVAALQGALHVVPVFIWAPEEEGQFQPGRCSRWWLLNSLKALEADFAALGSSLIHRCAPESRTALLQLAQETGAQALYFNHLYDPISMVRDNEVKAAMAEQGIACHTFNSDVLYEPWEVLSPSGQPLTSFADFWDRVNSMAYAPSLPLPVPASMPAVHSSIVSLDLSDLGLLSAEEASSNEQLEFTWRPGGRGAHLVLEEFVLQRMPHFSTNRAKTDVRSTSRLSPHLHPGEISTRHIYYVVKQREAAFAAGGEKEAARAVRVSCDDYLRQMGYREYSRYLSFHFPFTHERSLLEHLRACPWQWNQSHFKAWRQGRTGYPLVDAAMRELWSTGWIHNRMRVVCASFLVKNLLLPWQWGLKHFWDAQLDADLESAALGWQYVSGCLADAHPFSYMLDHKKEAVKFDPSGNYVRRWLPVLSRLPNKWIHRPFDAPAEVLQDAGVELGSNYDWPIVTDSEARAQVTHACSVIERCIDARGGSEGGATSEPYRMPTAPVAAGQAGMSKLPPLAAAAATAARYKARIAAPEVQQVPDLEVSDEEVLSNTLAETRAPAGLAGAPSGVSGIMSCAPVNRRGAGDADDDTVTVNGGAPPASRPQKQRRQQDGQQASEAAPPAQHAADIVPDPQPGAIPDGAGLLAARNPAEVAAAIEPGGTAADVADAATQQQRQQQQPLGAGASKGRTGEGDEAGVEAADADADAEVYPASWSREEVAAYQAGDMALLSSLQAKRLQAEVASVSNRSRSQGSLPASVGQLRNTQEQQSQRQPPPGSRLAAAAAQEQAFEADPAPRVSTADAAAAAERLPKRKREGGINASRHK